MLYIFSSDSPSIQLSEMINAFCHSYSDFKFVALDNLPSLKQHDKVLFAWEADICGVDTSILKLIHKAYLSSPKFFSGCKGSILCFSKTIFYTKYFSVNKYCFLQYRQFANWKYDFGRRYRIWKI